MDKMRSMLAEIGLGQEFRTKATSTTIYLVNITLNFNNGFKIPEELWSGHKPDLSHLRRFRCSMYVYTVQEKTSPRALKDIFLVGYPFEVKGYHVWLEEEEKCTTSRNILFYEEELYENTMPRAETRD
ncbi:hypothetical protein Bca4012_084220 [Brassica carinata]